MKRFLLSISIILLALCSCAKPAKGGFFEYQKKIESAVISYSDDLGEYKARLSFKEMEGERYCYKIEYLSPDKISGLVFQRDEGKTELRMDGLCFDGDTLDTERIFRIALLFDLKSEDIITLSQSANKSIAKGKSEDINWKVITDKSGTPLEIKSRGAYNCNIKIESLS